MKFLSDKLIARVRDGDVDALIKLDEHGLIIGPDESVDAFADRVVGLRGNIESFFQRIDSGESIDFYGFTLKSSQSIPPSVFKKAAKATKSLYGFEVDWVPGYFCDDKMGILFAGCAMYSYEDMIAVFVVRNAFKNSPKWFIYSRDELLSHELTHIAHLGFKTPNYEEYLAFHGSPSGFRRLVGGMFRRVRDTVAVLAGVVLLMFYQVGNVVLRPPEMIWSMPTPLAFGAALCPFFYLAGVWFVNHRRFKHVESLIANAYPDGRPLPVLFRCSESEIQQLSRLTSDELNPWVDGQAATSPRWHVIRRRFLS